MSDESEADERMGALYRLYRGLQGSQLVALVCLVCLVEQDRHDERNQPDKPDEPQVLELAGGLCLFPFEFGPAAIEPLRSCAGCIQCFGACL